MSREARLNLVRRAEQGPRDRLGRPLEIGDLIYAQMVTAPLIEIINIRRQMDPKLPPGWVIEAAAPFHFFVSLGEPNAGLTLVRGHDAPEQQPEVPPVAPEGDGEALATPEPAARLLLMPEPKLAAERLP